MNIPAVFRKLIADDAAAYAVFADRVYPLHTVDTPTFPLIIITPTSITPSTNKIVPSQVDIVMVQLDIYSDKYSDNCAHAELVRTAVDMKIGDVTFMGDTIKMDGIHFDSGSQDFSDIQGSNGQMRIYRHVHNYSVRIKRN